MENSFKVPQLLLRLGMGISFTSAVLDRLGILGPFGERNIEWGNWDNFIDYTATLMPFLDRPMVNVMGGIASSAELIFGIMLIIGWKTRQAAIGTCLLLLVFTIAMTLFLGIKAPINYSVYTGISASLLLSKLQEYEWSLDQFLKGKASTIPA